MFKHVRNFISDSLATLVDRVPATEPAFLAVGNLTDPLPLVRTIYLRAIDTLGLKWRQSGRQYRTISIWNHTFVFDITDFTVKSFYFHDQIFERETTRFVVENVPAGGIVMDIGANKGYITILAALKVGSAGKVFSFEPNPLVHQELVHHIELNNLTDRVTRSSYALSDTDGENVVFYVSNIESNSGLSSLTPQADLLESNALSAKNTIKVETRTLDRFLMDNNIEKRIDLIKIDVEGAELKVLEGSRKLLENNPPKNWIIETKRNSGVEQFMKQFGYSTSILDYAGDTVNMLCVHPS